MPCYKCNNKKYKYGQNGDCVFDTLERCQAAERAIHARENKELYNTTKLCDSCKKTDLKSKVM